jgi:hypothetical protein
MIGLSVVQKEFLSIADSGILNESYCGVCFSLRKIFGELSCFLVNYDARFLVLLVIAQSGSTEKNQVLCPLKGYLGHQSIVVDFDATNFASAITMLLLDEKLQDNARDDKSPFATILSKLQNKANRRRALELLSQSGFPIEFIEKAKIFQVEAEHHFINLRSYMEPTASLLGEVFAHTANIAKAPKNFEFLQSLGKAIGKLVVLIDVVEDLDKTKPLPVSLLAELCLMFAEQFCIIQASLQQIYFREYESAIRNILTRGLPNKAAKSLSNLWHNNHWIGILPFPIYETPYIVNCRKCNLPHRSISNKKGDNSKQLSLWTTGLTLADAPNIAKELGLKSIEEYMLTCMFSSFYNYS